MAKISTYPEIVPPALDDLIIGTDISNSNATKNFVVEDLLALNDAYKVYMFKLDRSTGNPVASLVYQNTIGSMVLSNGPSGTVTATLIGTFTTDKVIIFTQGVPTSPLFSSTVDNINFPGATNNFIEIRVYN